MNARLIIAILTSLIDEIIIIALILWVLPRLGVHIPWWALILIILAFLVYAAVVFKLGSRILRKKPVAGLTDMRGLEGKTAGILAPRGFVRIQGELWEARSQNGAIAANTYVVVIEQDGFKLIVRSKD